MFDVGAPELLLIGIVALLVVGPKDLPRLLRTVGGWVGKARATARHFRTGVDAMIREAELEEMQKQWDAQNADIMKAHPPTPSEPAAPEAAAPEAAPEAGLPAPEGSSPKP